jgi:hypothetical protein
LSDAEHVLLISNNAVTEKIDKEHLTIADCVAKALSAHNVPDLGIQGHRLTPKTLLAEDI